MNKNVKVISLRKLSQQYVYTSIRMHELIGKQVGLNGTDHKYLGFLLQKGQMTAGEFAELTGLTTGAITGLIDRFESRNFVKRHPDPIDRRKVIIIPDTDKIIKSISPFYEDFQQNTDDLIASFTTEQLNVLEKYFQNAMEIMLKKIEKINNN